MHLIKDENGNVISHGHDEAKHSHEHTHENGVTHSHEHSHSHGEGHTHTHEDHHSAGCEHCEGGDCMKETVALLTYMLQHNEHHAAELDQMAENLAKMGLDAASRTIKDGVADFQKGNMRLGLALKLVSEEQKQ